MKKAKREILRKTPKGAAELTLPRSYLELDELITRVLCDTAPREGKADAVYLFGETPFNENSVLEIGALLWRLGRVRKVAIYGLEDAPGVYPNFFSVWKSKLADLGVKKDDIVGIVPAAEFPPSTDAEALGLVRYAARSGWQTLYVTAPPLHQLRAFISTVSAMMREGLDLKLYSFVGMPQSWEEYIVHSQGILKGTRSELLAVELQKINNYYQKGDLVSAEKMLEYLNKRDC